MRTVAWPLFVVLSAWMASPAPARHKQDNPLFQQLVEQGVDVGAVQPAKLCEPTIADGLSEEKQQAVLLELVGSERKLERFMRESVVAPHICRVKETAKNDDRAVRTIDFWFIAYTPIEALEADSFVQILGSGESKSQEAFTGQLSPEQLAARALTLQKPSESGFPAETYGYLKYDLLGKVRLTMTGYAFATRSDESIVAAAYMSPDFARDKEFPNTWQLLSRDRQPEGDPQPYSGGSCYIKSTRLRGSDRAVFVEGHIMFLEPNAWFGGRNQLRSKLPAVVQSQVRTLRRAMLRTAQKADTGKR